MRTLIQSFIAVAVIVFAGAMPASANAAAGLAFKSITVTGAPAIKVHGHGGFGGSHGGGFHGGGFHSGGFHRGFGGFHGGGFHGGGFHRGFGGFHGGGSHLGFGGYHGGGFGHHRHRHF